MGKWTSRIRAGMAGTVLLVPLGTLGPAGSAAPAPAESVIVRAGTVAAAADAVEQAGGTVEFPLELIDGVAARVTPQAERSLEAAGMEVSADPRLKVTSGSFGDQVPLDVRVEAVNPGPAWSPSAGKGVAVALVDTGVAETPDLAGRVVHGLDLSGERDGVDRYGHGTFMAGLIAGDGSASTAGPVRHVGIAPGARVVSVKVAGRNGSTSMGKVIAGVGWAVAHADDHGIRVLNLSLGRDGNVPVASDPLSAAVEAAWAAGVTVVTAAGNKGAGSVTSPGRDPWVITAGASDPAGTASTHDDTAPSWSSQGRVNGVAKPELVAPGVSVVSLRAPGSTIDREHPEARVGEAYFRGSGTSMATAEVAGAAAVLAQRHPGATPDDIKGALVTAADPVAGSLGGALDLAGADAAEPQPAWEQSHPVALPGFGRTPAKMPWASTRWSSPRWSDADWASTRWSDADWASTRWSSTRWSDADWTSTRWSSTRWSDADWASTGWSSTGWSAEAWGAAAAR